LACPACLLQHMCIHQASCLHACGCGTSIENIFLMNFLHPLNLVPFCISAFCSHCCY
jgi:hypothetical protein